MLPLAHDGNRTQPKEKILSLTSVEHHSIQFPSQIPAAASSDVRNMQRQALWICMLLFEVMIYGSYSTLIHLSKEDGRLPYSTASVVMLIEASKFLASLILLLTNILRGSATFIPPSQVPLRQTLVFAIPALLYAFNNNVGIHMQLYMDPSTFQILCNLKIAVTPILYRIIIKRHIRRSQWIAIGLLILAGVCDSYGGFVTETGAGNPQQMFITLTGLILVTITCTISGLAAVYTEHILKQNLRMSLHQQNLLLYSYGLMLNFVTYHWQTSEQTETNAGFLAGFSMYTWLVVVTQVCNGLIMSVIMKHGNSLMRLFVISGGMLSTTVYARLAFGTAITGYFLSSAAIVICAIYLYNMK